MSNTSKKRDLSLEIMRIIAMFFVIFNHTQSKGYFLFSKCNPDTANYWIYLFISIMDKFAVPLYFMLSGALLLGREENLKTLFRKRISRTALTLLLISIMYYTIDIANGSKSFNGWKTVQDFFVSLICGNVKFHLWFMYSYLVFLLILPFLRRIVKGLKKQEYIYMFILCFFVMVFKPIFEYTFFSGKHIHYTLDLLETNNIVFPIIGYYLYNVADISRLKKRILIPAWGINIALTVVACVLTYLRMKDTGIVDESHSQQFHRMFAMTNAAVIFITVKRLTPDIKNKAAQWIISTTGGCTFGVYLFHPMIMKDIRMQELWNAMSSGKVNQMFVTFIFCILVFLISAIFTFLLKLIPPLKKLL